VKQSLQLKIGQSLTMTPQLQQAIRLLQLSTVELQQEIQEILEANLMLENEEHNLDSDTPSSEAQTEDAATQDSEYSPEDASTSEQLSSESLPDDMPVDAEWGDIYQQSTTPSTPSSSASSDENFNFESRNGTTENLQEHLLWQLNLTPFSDRDRYIAMSIIDAVEPSGLLNQNIEDIFKGLAETWKSSQESLSPENEIEQEMDVLEFDEVEAVLHRVQQFDPPGVAAQDLQDCLMIQLNQLDEGTPWLLDAKLVVSEHLDLLAAHDYKNLIRKSGIRENTLRETIKLIQSLNPQPGNVIETSDTEYVAPDVYVMKKEGRWHVSLNPDIAPRLRINQEYASLIKRADNSQDNTVLKDHLQEARWFLKSLESRNETLLKVATAIVEHQRNFLEYGEEAMKPLVLHDIAEIVEMHESTISRVTTQKYMHTPQGLFELKYFFSSHVATAGGGECSSTAIRALIKKLVNAENPQKPLSDSKITQLLEEEGIKVARRTIAKYRESLHIPPSNERKRLG